MRYQWKKATRTKRSKAGSDIAEEPSSDRVEEAIGDVGPNVRETSGLTRLGNTRFGNTFTFRSLCKLRSRVGGKLEPDRSINQWQAAAD